MIRRLTAGEVSGEPGTVPLEPSPGEARLALEAARELVAKQLGVRASEVFEELERRLVGWRRRGRPYLAASRVLRALDARVYAVHASPLASLVAQGFELPPPLSPPERRVPDTRAVNYRATLVALDADGRSVLEYGCVGRTFFYGEQHTIAAAELNTAARRELLNCEALAVVEELAASPVSSGWVVGEVVPPPPPPAPSLPTIKCAVCGTVATTARRLIGNLGPRGDEYVELAGWSLARRGAAAVPVCPLRDCADDLRLAGPTHGEPLAPAALKIFEEVL